MQADSSQSRRRTRPRPPRSRCRSPARSPCGTTGAATSCGPPPPCSTCCCRRRSSSRALRPSPPRPPSGSREAGGSSRSRVYAVAYVLIQALVFLPLSWYAGYVRQHAYGLSTETRPRGWVTGPRRSRSRPWSPRCCCGSRIGCCGSAPGAGGSGPGSSPPRSPCWSMIVPPVYIAPLFDDYGRMRDPRSSPASTRLAASAGIPDSRIYEVRKSDETTAGERLRDGLRRHEADRALGHAGGPAGAG